MSSWSAGHSLVLFLAEEGAALDGQAVRMKYRPSTDRSEALQALRRQVALARFSVA